ncbi:MAG: threonine--tRNA ligase [Acidimicrobiia bacterium]|nr:threonine--tRNA ligase [Acidimicrobiia bacterium]
MNVSIEIKFPDDSQREFPDGTTGLQVAESIGARLAGAAVAVRLDGAWLDLTAPLPHGGRLEIVTERSEEGRQVLRHSAAHVLAQAVLTLYDGASFAIGPPIEDGFYYDFDIGRPFTPEDLERIEEKMADIIDADQPFIRSEMSKSDALEIFADQPFKREIIESVDQSEVEAGQVVSAYSNDGFIDLCRGPHVPSTGRLSAVKLLRTAGAYWRGDEKRPQLQRIYGTAWEDKKALNEYLHRLEEAERRDHRKLGAELDLFSFPPELGSGLAVWHPKGGLMRMIIEDYSRRTHLTHDYQIVATPHVAKAHLWETSGHLDFYADAMFPEMELDHGDGYYVKPMNCPFHILVFKSSSRSYREFPLRLFELGTVYRYERSGVIHGLLRARGFTQDDSHIFCTRGQLGDELQNLLDFTLMVIRDFGFSEFEAELSTRPDKYVGEVALWDEATEALAGALVEAGLEYRVAHGEGAFYGPKIDVHIKDAIGRRWQLSTIQVDFSNPERFDLEYTTTDNTRERPVMVHRALLGSVERFFGILVEHYAGAFPMWLAPVQATIIPVADRHLDYAEGVAARLKKAGLRVEVDETGETVGEKIRRALVGKHPAVLVVGDRDVENGTVGLRYYGDETEQRGFGVTDAVAALVEAARPPR